MRILIVDDEKIVRIALSTLIKWDEYGFKLMGAVADGYKALEVIETEPIDIVIMDLVMPNMDGLELIRTLNERKFTGKFVVLSNYDDYAYVREAMKLGAEDYMLKLTLKPDELILLLTKITEQLLTERELKEQDIHMKIKLNETQLQQRNSIWRELLLDQEQDKVYLMQETQKYGIPFDRLAGNLIMIRIDDYVEALSNGKINNKRLLSFSIANIVKETVSDHFAFDFIEMESHQYIVIVYEQSGYFEEPSWLLLMNNLVQMLKLYLNLSVSITLSDAFVGLKQLRERYTLCLRASTYNFYTGPASVLVAGHSKLTQSLHSINYVEWLDQVKAAVEVGNTTLVLENISILFNEAKQIKWDPSALKFHLLGLLSDLDNMILKWNTQVLPSTEQNRVGATTLLESFESDISQSESMEGLILTIEQAMQEAINLLYQVKSNIYRKEVFRITEILQENVENKITLDRLAQEVNMNVNYLCRVFKQDTGRSIVQYMNELKINKAIELLKLPDTRIKEVASQVGIDDPFYFNRVFKKIVGLSPSDFRKKLLATK
ncbi:two-component system response regulator YesN [Paenibacillus sp. PastF-3]|uniref:response regulator transcription factor n=1 Tax=Paenibacillus sp. PastF-3 TaxID=2940626 RepID=UPI002474F232|nr:response regulator [Paenibacillus sp. PastF-3]MDH6369367.1 two-component system response regulator YesN [Paenibacillus sp. PastF-3]